MVQLIKVDGKALFDAMLDDSIADLIEECQAVYFWRRNLAPPTHVVLNPESFSQWIHSAVQTPYAKVNQKRLAHFLTLPTFDICGGPLTEKKTVDLNPWLNSSKRRQFTKDFLTALTDLGPPLYVGEAGNLQQRVRTHLNGETDFARTLTERLRLKWSDVILYYCRLGPPQQNDTETDVHKNELYSARIDCGSSCRRGLYIPPRITEKLR